MMMVMPVCPQLHITGENMRHAKNCQRSLPSQFSMHRISVSSGPPDSGKESNGFIPIPAMALLGIARAKPPPPGA
jgi:hypothetical protein